MNNQDDEKELWVTENAITGQAMAFAWEKPSDWISNHPDFRVSRYIPAPVVKEPLTTEPAPNNQEGPFPKRIIHNALCKIFGSATAISAQIILSELNDAGYLLDTAPPPVEALQGPTSPAAVPLALIELEQACNVTDGHGGEDILITYIRPRLAEIRRALNSFAVTPSEKPNDSQPWPAHIPPRVTPEDIADLEKAKADMKAIFDSVADLLETPDSSLGAAPPRLMDLWGRGTFPAELKTWSEQEGEAPEPPEDPA